ncbi:MAG: EF-P lysine aminoacylase EpmA [Verrucomicrobia bacterium]|nr:EF-P lysine aminoacylase EpmA [Verrucomicrobiota bacterium]
MPPGESVPGSESMRLERLAIRSQTLYAIRDWFRDRGFIEVETPIRVAAPAPEVHIDAFRSESGFLRASPELFLKRLLAQGAERLFEIGPCFRRGERGVLHNPEYTMLEWYRTDTDYLGVLEDCCDLLRSVAERVTGSRILQFQGASIDLGLAWEEIRIRDAYLDYAGWDPFVDFDEDRFDIDFIEKILPVLKGKGLVVYRDYPIECAALSRCAENTPSYAERWELLVGGVELANAYTELCDATEQRQRFEAWNQQRGAMRREVYPIDEAFLAALDAGLPACGGIALGVDRLLMLLCNASDIKEVRAYVDEV